MEEDLYKNIVKSRKYTFPAGADLDPMSIDTEKADEVHLELLKY